MAKIKILPPETSRLIAAGEVIDRPAAVLREFLDNSIDSGAREISVDIEGGGAELIRVSDDGSGMDREDLELAILPHATSKISRADDLLTAKSLGFRGEALASIAAAARLEITSRDAASPSAHRLVAGPEGTAGAIGTGSSVTAVPGRIGTQIQASRLFDNYPARKQFLKRSQAEAALCKQVFVDKAMAHPDIGFRFSSDGRLGLVLRPDSPEARVASLYGELPGGLVYRVRFSGPHCEGSVIIASPGYYRSDRRLMQSFVNRRRVQDLGLLQALDHAFDGFLPGGAHPAAFLFAEVDPAFADFNIHPAKREVRFKDFEALRKSFVQAVKAFLLELSRMEPDKVAPAVSRELGLGLEPVPEARERSPGYAEQRYAPEGRSIAPDAAWSDFPALRTALPGGRDEGEAAEEGPEGEARDGQDAPRYIGTALGLFLVAEWKGALYLIDQHAAHERLLFDKLMSAPPRVQDFLVPAVFEAEDDAEEARLEAALPELAILGFGLEKEGCSWSVTSMPAPLERDPIGALREIMGMLTDGGDVGRESRAEGGPAPALRGVRAAALATVACRSAVKDGDLLDAEAAASLAERALALPEPRCPHGRPVWVRLSREELYRLVRRLV